MQVGDVIDLYFSDSTGARVKSKAHTILCAHLADADSKVATSTNPVRNSWRLSIDLNSGSQSRNVGRVLLVQYDVDVTLIWDQLL